MKILFLCHRFPFPPRRGGKIRPFNVIRHLHQRHEVTVVSLVRSRIEAEAGQGLRNYCSAFFMEHVSPSMVLTRMLARLPTPVPSSMGYFYSPALTRRIQGLLHAIPFDLIFVHCAFVAPYVATTRNIPKILDFGDMDSQKWLAYASARAFPLSMGYYIEGLKLRRTEAQLAAQFDMCTCTTPAEMSTLKSYDVDVPLGCFPNGVDTEYFRPADFPYDPDTVCFIGKMDYYPNQHCMLDFCHTILPLIRVRRPGVKLTIVGADPPRSIIKLGKLPGVTVTGTVADVRPYVHAAAVTVAPLRIARGIQNKILESMAMGVPTVASPSAAAGVDAEPGRHLLTASTPLEYADAILRLLEDPLERRRFSEAGRARTLSHHTWDRSMEILDRLIQDCLAPEASSIATATRACTHEKADSQR